MNSIKSINMQIVRVPFVAHMKRIMPIAVCLSLLVCATVPQVAHAGMLWDAVSGLENSLKSWILSIAGACFGIYFEIIKQTINSSYITGSFSSIFGTENVYNVVKSVHQAGVIPVAQSILSLLAMVQLVKISQRIDATSTLPAIKEIAFLAVFLVIFSWLINNSLDIISAVFDIFNKIATSDPLKNIGIGEISSTVDFTDQDVSNASLGGCVALVLVAVLSALVGLIAYIVVFVVALARCIQLYIMAAFSPIPLSLLGFDETRQAGISFIKNFCAACLAGAIMVFILVAYPSIISALAVSQNGNLATDLIQFASGSWVVGGALVVLKWLAASILLVVGLVKSGGWAKEIMGA